jgi:hypothetical protein
VAHVCNPSFSGGKDQEDGGLKPARENSPQNPVLKIGLVEWFRVKALTSSLNTGKKKRLWKGASVNPFYSRNSPVCPHYIPENTFSLAD